MFDPKPGVKTSEFWLTIVTIVFTAMVSLGYLPKADADQLYSPVTQMVVQVFALITNGLIVYRYLVSRYAQKQVAQQQSLQLEMAKAQGFLKPAAERSLDPPRAAFEPPEIVSPEDLASK